MVKLDVHEDPRGFRSSPELVKGEDLPQVNRRILDEVPEAVAWDTKLLLILAPVTCDILSMCLRAFFGSVGPFNSGADAWLVG